MQKKKQNKPIKQIIAFIAIIILLLLLVFAEDIIKLNNKNKINLAENSENKLISNEPNTPQLSAGMIPVKWNGTNWIITTSNDKDWYDYSKGKPAYIMLNDGIYQSELIRDMTDKKLAEDNVGVGVLDDTKICGTIFMWIPRFSINNESNIKYIKNVEEADENWTIPELFAYRQASETIPDFLLTGIWIEKDADANFADKITQMNREGSIYGFIKNTMAISSNQTNQNEIQNYYNKLNENSVGNEDQVVQITDLTNPNRIILKIVNQSNQEPMKVRGLYNKNTRLIEVQVTYSMYGIEKILYENTNELPMIKNANNNAVTSTTEGIELEEGRRSVTIIDKKGNTKILNVEVTYPRTLTFNANGGTVTPEHITNYYGTNITMPTPTISGYTITFNSNGGTSYGKTTVSKTFAGWYTELTEGEKRNYTTMPKENETLYAHWNEASYKLPTPKKSGYSFAGWYENSSLTKRVGTGGDTYIPERNVTLYAKWTAVYAKLYTDGTLAFTATNKTISGKTIDDDYGNVADRRRLFIWYSRECCKNSKFCR